MHQSCGNVGYKRRSLAVSVKRYRSTPSDTCPENQFLKFRISLTMRPLVWCSLVIITGAICSGSGDGEHVHFKIHVPDVVKHQIHTKVIFVHVHKPKPKKKPAKKKPPVEDHHKEHHHEEWSSWSSYGHQEDHEDKNSFEKSHADNHNKNHQDEKIRQGNELGHKHYQTSPVNSQNDEFQKGSHNDLPGQGYMGPHTEQPEKIPLYNHYSDSHSHFPHWNSYDGEQYHHSGNQDWTPGRMVKFSHPRQYAVHENVRDRSNEVEPYEYQYEKGYTKGLISQSKHLFEDQSSKFEDSKHEEESGSRESSEKDSVERTHAGRYLVDDTEYENYLNHRRDKDSISRRYK